MENLDLNNLENQEDKKEISFYEFIKNVNKEIKNWDSNKLKSFIDENKIKLFRTGNPFSGTHKEDIIKKGLKDFEIPEITKEIKAILEIVKDKGFIAGGSIRQFIGNKILEKEKNISSDDYDIYCYKEEDRIELVKKFIDTGYKCSFINSNCVNFESPFKVQIITSFYGDIQGVIDEFDFTICRVGINDKFEIYLDKDFEENLKKNLLVIKTVQCPIGAIRRIIKYTKKGFFMTGFQMLKLYLNWDERKSDYKAKLIEYLMKMEESENGKLEQKDFDSLEEILIKFD